MVHCRSPTKCLKNGHFPSNQIQIVPDSNCCKLFMDNGLPAGANFSPDTSNKEHRRKANKKRRRTNMQKKAAFPCHLKAIVPCGRIYGFWLEVRLRCLARRDRFSRPPIFNEISFHSRRESGAFCKKIGACS